ncbi:MAG: ribonuclease Y [Dehalococcoidales bacterium]|nr:ribonuclease Y [Dehalococcoidales bacterium]MDD5122395.1 ribonuclease Y [Dehalococcoidales bacterium]
MLDTVLVIVFSFIIGAVFGAMAMFLTKGMMAARQATLAKKEAAQIIAEAKAEAKEHLREAKKEADREKTLADGEIRERRSEVQRQENRLAQKEATLERKLEEAERRDQSLEDKNRQIEEIKAEIEKVKQDQIKQLETVSQMSSSEAKTELFDRMEKEMQAETTRRLHQWETKIKLEADEKARNILSQVIQRSAAEVVSETTATAVPLPGDDMKGRLIGREGRNIKALEQATGVDLIIDDTPGAVTLSSFDPVRREIARQAVEKLIMDGRIHPARIEEVVNKAREDVEALILQAGEQATLHVGVQGLHLELIKLLGRLKYRTSYGQNVLAHSIEVAQLSGLIAAELGVKVHIAKKAGLLHDIGKAVDREIEGSHAQIGADLVKQWDRNQDVIRGVAEHHLEAGDTSIWGFIVSAADAISSARPGARRESLESYLKRLTALEDIAGSFKGVEKSYAIQAGREVRILVKPEEVDDLSAMRMARDIVKKIEETLEYPGQIRITVIRETRAVDIAK